jgi:hypothetical protein
MSEESAAAREIRLLKEAIDSLERHNRMLDGSMLANRIWINALVATHPMPAELMRVAEVLRNFHESEAILWTEETMELMRRGHVEYLRTALGRSDLAAQRRGLPVGTKGREPTGA